jgi:hypothetical protein
LVNTWLLIEQPGAWGPHALVDSGFPSDEVSPLLQAAEELHIRVLLIRQRKGETLDRSVFVAYSRDNGDGPTLRKGTVGDPAELSDLDLAALTAGRPDFGDVVDHPLYLVCTHGRHDICCADKGRPLFRAMSEVRPEQTWEVSHIGGDRFAGNLLVLPRGDYFGRLDPADAGPLVAEYEAGRLDLDHHRGKSTQPRLVQAAEHFLRDAEGLSGFDDVPVVEYRRESHGRAQVVFRGPEETEFVVRVTAHELPDPDYLTCRAEGPGWPVAYELDSFSLSVR